MAEDAPQSSIRLSDLRRAHVADASLENLLSMLSAKIQVCSRLAVFEYEAGSEGHPAIAATFREIAANEQRSFHVLLACLRQHLVETSEGDAAQSDPANGERR